MIKTVIVTGASRGTIFQTFPIKLQSNLQLSPGIGLAIAKYLLDHSHNVVVLARGKEALEKLCSQYPNQVRVVAGDLADLSLAQIAIDVTKKEFGRIHGLVLNHGTLPPVGNVAEIDIKAWKHHFDINFFSAVAFVWVR